MIRHIERLSGCIEVSSTKLHRTVSVVEGQ